MKEAPQRASCVFHAEGKFLFSTASDSTRRGEFLMPIGGNIEAGESPEEAIIREVREEIGVEVEAPKLVGAFEETFDFDGEISLGTVFCFLVEAPITECFPEVLREENGKELPLEWVSLAEVRKGNRIVFPEGLSKVLEAFGESE